MCNVVAVINVVFFMTRGNVIMVFFDRDFVHCDFFVYFSVVTSCIAKRRPVILHLEGYM